MSEAVRLIKDYYGIAALKDFDPIRKNEESKTGEITEGNRKQDESRKPARQQGFGRTGFRRAENE